MSTIVDVVDAEAVDLHLLGTVEESFVRSDAANVMQGQVRASCRVPALLGILLLAAFISIKFFPVDSLTSEENHGGRAGSELLNTISKAATAVTALDQSNFDDIVLDDTKDVLVEFYAPWDGHSKRLAPVYEKVAEAFEDEENVVIANVDADAAKNTAIARRYGVSGYPTIKWFPRDNKAGEEYSGGRTRDAFVDYVSEKAGVVVGTEAEISSTKGTDAELNKLAKEYVTATDKASVKEKIMARVAVTPGFEYYGTVVNKIEDKGDGYPAKEIARLTSMSQTQMTADQADAVTIRINILRMFGPP